MKWTAQTEYRTPPEAPWRTLSATAHTRRGSLRKLSRQMRRETLCPITIKLHRNIVTPSWKRGATGTVDYSYITIAPEGHTT